MNLNPRSKFFALFLAVFYLISFLPAFAQSFTDIGPNFWAAEPINALSQARVISGYNDGTFRPNNPVTRAEFATMIVKAIGENASSGTMNKSFRDVPTSFWAFSSIQTAASLGLIGGFPDGTFKPNSYITRAEVLSIAAKASGQTMIDAGQARGILSKYHDANKIPSWALVPVAQAVSSGIAVDYPQSNFLMPDRSADRAYVAAVLYNLRGISGQGLPPATSQQPGNVVNSVTQAAGATAGNQAVLRGSVATLAPYTVLPTTLETPISSEVARVGDPVVATVSTNVTSPQGGVIIPAGSQVSGTIAAVTPAQYANRSAKININFNSLKTPDGSIYPLSASVATETGVLESGSLKGTIGQGALKTVIGAGAGAALGTALGAILGKTGKGAVYGTAIGGGLGVVGAALAKGGPIQIPRGEPLFIKLTAPLNVDVTQR